MWHNVLQQLMTVNNKLLFCCKRNPNESKVVINRRRVVYAPYWFTCIPEIARVLLSIMSVKCTMQIFTTNENYNSKTSWMYLDARTRKKYVLTYIIFGVSQCPSDMDRRVAKCKPERLYQWLESSWILVEIGNMNINLSLICINTKAILTLEKQFSKYRDDRWPRRYYYSFQTAERRYNISHLTYMDHHGINQPCFRVSIRWYLTVIA